MTFDIKVTVDRSRIPQHGMDPINSKRNTDET